jgi:hypothetical protein
MVEIVNRSILIILLQKFDFNHCKGSLHQHFLKNTYQLLLIATNKYPHKLFYGFSKYHIKRINKNGAHYNLKAKLQYTKEKN